MTAADRYPAPSRRRRACPDGDVITIPRAHLLDLVRAQTVTLNVFRAWAGLRPVGDGGGGVDRADGRGVESEA